MRITFEVDGRIKFVYDDETAVVVREVGDLSIKRASHVEPSTCWEGAWEADMDPVGGPILGPFETRKEALEAEREWLFKNGLPRPR